MITKQQLVQALSSIPNDTVIGARFRNQGYYSLKYEGAISGFILNFNAEGKIYGSLCVKELPKPEEKPVESADESVA